MEFNELLACIVSGLVRFVGGYSQLKLSECLLCVQFNARNFKTIRSVSGIMCNLIDDLRTISHFIMSLRGGF